MKYSGNITKFFKLTMKTLKATLVMPFLCIYHYFWITLIIVLVPTFTAGEARQE